MNRRDFIKGVGVSAISVAVIANSGHARPTISELKPNRKGQDDIFSGEYEEDIIIDLASVDWYSVEHYNDHAPMLDGSKHLLATRERIRLEMCAPHQAVLDWLRNASDYRQNVRVVLKTIQRGDKTIPVSWDSEAFNAVTIVDMPAVIVSATLGIGGSQVPSLSIDLERVYG